MRLAVTVVLALLSAFPNANCLPLKRATVCNGHAELCNRSYGNITFVGAHNSYAYSEDPFALARDQEVDVQSQLDLGVRLLQAQAHLFVLFHQFSRSLCISHAGTTENSISATPVRSRLSQDFVELTSNGLHLIACSLFDGGPVVDYLGVVKTYLDANPNEVITLLFTNPEGLNLPNVWAPVFVASGISHYFYIPPSLPIAQSDWPTLGQLIDSGKRVLMFMDYGAEGYDGGVVDYILPEFEMIWETPFTQTNSSFPCSVDRTKGPLPTTSHMYMINHSLNVNIIPIGGGVIVSDPYDAETTNGIPSILAHVNGCTPLGGGRAPNFLLLDFVNIGEGVEAADLLNGFTMKPSATPSATSSTSHPSATSAGERLGAGWVWLIMGVGVSVGVGMGAD